MITHKEAEILTSARQDAPLDPVVERELQAHLATCEECRAFAVATEQLTAGIAAMPSIPVNPRTRREVMERVQRGRNPLAGLFAGLGGGLQSGPVMAAAATLVIVGLFGWLALDRLVFEDGGSEENQIAAVPTEEPVDLFVASPTQVPPTETVEPTEPVETEVPGETVVPTVTTEPEPTATTPPEPTATTEPEPTATTPPEPTATTEPEPTATSVPEEDMAAADTDGEDTEPTDLTTLSQPVETEQPVQPTATTAPTEEPTEEPTEVATEEPTEVATEAPTEVATQEPTTAPEPTNTPGIEPMEGMQVVESDGTGAADPTQLPGENGAAGTVDQPDGTGSGPSDDEAPPIEPTGDEAVSGEDAPEEVATVETSGDDIASLAIEPMGEDGVGGTTPDSEIVSTPASEEPQEIEVAEGVSLIEYSVPYTNIAGDPAGQLDLTPGGRLEFVSVPDGASRTTYDGFQLQSGGSQPSVVQLCGDGFCEPTMEAPDSETWQGDVPLGVVGDTTYFMRLHSDRTEIFAASSSGTALIEPQLLTELGPTSAPSAVYDNGGTLVTWLSTGQWLEISGSDAVLYSGSFGDPYNVRFAPLANSGPLIGYFSGGTLVIAPVAAPDAPVLTLPADGIDFDLTGGGTRVAVIQGNSIVIYDMEGNQLQVYSGGDVQPGSVIWLNSGIVYVDRNTGMLYQIPETAP